MTYFYFPLASDGTLLLLLFLAVVFWRRKNIPVNPNLPRNDLGDAVSEAERAQAQAEAQAVADSHFSAYAESEDEDDMEDVPLDSDQEVNSVHDQWNEKLTQWSFYGSNFLFYFTLYLQYSRIFPFNFIMCTYFLWVIILSILYFFYVCINWQILSYLKKSKHQCLFAMAVLLKWFWNFKKRFLKKER